MTRPAIPILAILLLFACAPISTATPAQDKAAFVQYGNAGSITGGGVMTTIFPTDSVERRYISAARKVTRTDRIDLPPGSYAILRKIGVDEFGKLGTAITPSACLDAGTDVLIIAGPGTTQSRHENLCPTDAFQNVVKVLNGAVDALAAGTYVPD